MKKILERVTVTGADDSIEPSKLWDIYQRFPFVEFGILISNRAMPDGRVRFPSKKWLKELVKTGELKGSLPRFSGHLCGPWVDGFMSGHILDFDHCLVPGFVDLLGRIQINTHGQPCEVERLCETLGWVQNQWGIDVIFQLDGRVGTEAAKQAEAGGFDCHGLHDLSHGGGVLPEEWPKPIEGIWCGYAGGLCPENLHGQLSIIETLTDYTWIDAETHLFVQGKFDAERVEAFLEAAKPWVSEA